MISPHYDPMVAKLVVWEETRDRAIETLADIAESVEVWPVKTNAAFLANALLEDDFGEAELDTGSLGDIYHARSWMLRRAGAPALSKRFIVEVLGLRD